MKRPLALLVYLLLPVLALSATRRQGQAQASPLQVAIEPAVGNAGTEFTVAVKNFSWDDMVQAEVTALEPSENERAILTVEEEPLNVGPRRRANVPFTPPTMGFWEIEVRGSWLDGGSVSAVTEVPVATTGSTTGVVQRGDEVQGIVRRSDDLNIGVGIFLYQARAGERASFVVDWTHPLPYESDNAVYVTLLDGDRNSLAADVDFLPDVTFDEPGKYLLVLGVSDALESASYTLTITGALRGDEEGGELFLNNGVIGLIEPPNDEDIWQFSAEVGDVVAVGLRAPTTSGLDAELILQDANGVVLAANDDYDGNDPTLESILQQRDAGLEYIIPATGTYQIVARSDNAASSGPYRLLLHRATARPTASVLVAGRTAVGDKPASAPQPWQFEGEAGDEIVLQVEALEQGFDPVLTLYAPDSSEAGSDDDSGGDLNPRLTATLADDGVYTVVVGSYDGSGGRYSIALEAVGNSVDRDSSNVTPPETWLIQLASRSIIPGSGLAGIELGMAEDEVVEILGVPGETLPVESSEGEILHYAMLYRSEEKFLGLYVDPASRNVRSIRLSDSDFNVDGNIPLVHGISIGSSRIELVEAFGNPIRTYAHSTCPASLDTDRRATTYVYSGIEFWVCDENDSVYLLDIR